MGNDGAVMKANTGEWEGMTHICSVCDGTGWEVVGVFYPGTLFAWTDECPCRECWGKLIIRRGEDHAV